MRRNFVQLTLCAIFFSILLSACGSEKKADVSRGNGNSVTVTQNSVAATSSVADVKDDIEVLPVQPVDEKFADGDIYAKAYADKNPKLCAEIIDEPLRTMCVKETQALSAEEK